MSSRWISAITSTLPPVILVGRNPGPREDFANQPFQGRSGNVLRNGFLAKTATSPSPCDLATVYVMDVVRCMTVSDKPPNYTSHIKKCFPYTLADINNILNYHTNPKAAIVCLGAPASKAILTLLLHEANPKTQEDCFKNNARLVDHNNRRIFLLHTYHPRAYLRNPNTAHAIQTHMRLLTNWLQDKLVAVSQPHILKQPRMPNR